MSNKATASEKLEDYAVDVRNLRGVHERLVAKRKEIEVLVAEEQHLGQLETLALPDKEHLTLQAD